MDAHAHKNSLAVGLSFCAGIGLIFMILAAALGVIQGEAADSSTLGILFAFGIGMLATGIIAWFAVVQPQKHFDDINVAQYTGHEEHHDDAHEEEHAIVEH
ncbi:MAG: hypothetical protein K8L99_10980 [Anaerolineae bacterium]|nr:hypothetical protein [Anaerolineae bacterium]